MPNIKPLTYRELHHTLFTLNAIDAYVSASPDLKNPDLFDQCFERTLQIPNRFDHVVTAIKFPRMEHLQVPIDDLFILMSQYANMSDLLLQSEPQLGGRIPVENYAQYSLEYEKNPYAVRTENESRFFTRVIGGRRQDKTLAAVADFRLFYSSYAFWNYNIVTAHYISPVYHFALPRGRAYGVGPVLETIGHVYQGGQPAVWYVFDRDKIHKECCQVTPFEIFRYYYRPRRLNQEPQTPEEPTSTTDGSTNVSTPMPE